jgi:hypothetical protein
MKHIRLKPAYHESEAIKVGELKIENEVIPVYEISVKPQYETDISEIDMLKPEHEQEFLDVAQKL